MMLALVVAEVSAIGYIAYAQQAPGGGASLLRQVVGLPSIAAGVDYEGTRNPLLEIGIRSQYDVPNAHDYSLTTGFFGSPMLEDEYRAGIREYNFTWYVWRVGAENFTLVWGGYP